MGRSWLLVSSTRPCPGRTPLLRRDRGRALSNPTTLKAIPSKEMSIPFSNTHYRIPQGFGNLLEGLTREILREQPDNIPAFAAAYFENLLEKREKTNFDPAEWGAKVDDRFYNNHAFKEKPSVATDTKEAPPEKCVPEKDKPLESVKEQETQVSFVEEVSDTEEEEAAAVKIQAAFRGHKARKEMKKMQEESNTEEQ